MPHGHQTKKCCSPYIVERVNPFYSGHDWWPWRVGTILVHGDKTSLTCFFCTPSLSSSWHIYDLSWSAGWGETLRPTHSWVCYYQVPYGSLRDQYIWHHPIFINIWLKTFPFSPMIFHQSKTTFSYVFIAFLPLNKLIHDFPTWTMTNWWFLPGPFSHISRQLWDLRGGIRTHGRRTLARLRVREDVLKNA